MLCKMPTSRFNPRASALSPLPSVGIFDAPVSAALINMEWSSWVAGAFDKLTARFDEQDPDFELLIDIWQHLRREGAGTISVLPTIRDQELGAVRTTTSTTEVFVTGSNHSFTPTKANFLVRYMNICVNNSGANSTEVGVRFNAVAGTSPKNARTFQSGFAFVQASAIFEGVTPGVAHDLSLYWKVTGGTGTMSNATKLIIEIWEYD